MENIAVSVIIPVYNVEKYICDCIDSVLNQTLQNIEVIVLDDRSTDSSVEVIKEKYGDNSKVVLVENETNLGPSENRNKGLRMAKGKYVYFLDNDDMILPETLATLCEIAEERQADMLHMSSYYEPDSSDFRFGEGFRAKVVKEKPYSREITKLPDTNEYNNHDALIMLWLNFYRRKFLLEKSLFFESILTEDNLFTVACSIATPRIWVVPNTFYIYRQWEGSITHKKDDDRLKKLVESLVLGLRYLQKESSRLMFKENDTPVAVIQMAYFKRVFEHITRLYRNTSVEEKEMLVRKMADALKPLFGKDTFFMNIMMYYMASSLASKEEKR